ncbi:MAG: hypothetical protein UH103_06125 [Paludibacteraceae bacterium]|nr:hypothetical protein [Paludibacteraceae bacterium]
MNKNIITRMLIAVVIALVGYGCDPNYFNEHYLPDYDNSGEITDVKEIALTLTEDDYAAIAKNSENKTIAEAQGETAVAALSAIGKNHYFANADDVAAYIPAYLAQKYPIYDNGSLALITYTMALDIPADVAAMNAPAEYTLTEDDYKAIWGSDVDYATAVTPKTINKLKSVIPVAEGAKDGDYVVVTYNYSTDEPQKEEPKPDPNPNPDPNPDPDPKPEKYTKVLGSAVLDDEVEVKGYIAAVSSQGPILNDAGGSILLYKTTGVEVGDEVTVTGTISSYNNGFQIQGATVEKTGSTTVTYPEPMELTGAKMDELLTTRTADEYAYYAKMSGTVSVSGYYYNFNVPGAETAVGSVYGATEEVKAALADGMECTLYGYFCSISKQSGSPKFINIIVTSIEPKSAAVAQKRALNVKSDKQYAYFRLEGGKYVDCDIVAVQPADYTAMGQGYGNFTNPTQDNYLPAFLGEKYPYAQVDDKVYVGYRCYSGGATSWKVDEYVFTGEWTKTIYFTEKTDQFRKTEGKWEIDRTLELDFTNTSSADTKAFYQYCVNWVYDNKDVPMGAPARDNAGEIISTEIVLINGQKPAGNYWVSNYGNNEFYTGASAYYGNMDWRPSAVKGGFAAADMGNLSDDEILAKLKEHSAEVFAAVLGYMYPEMTLEEYKKVVIKVYSYGPNKNYSFTFDVTGQGEFAYVADSLIEF